MSISSVRWHTQVLLIVMILREQCPRLATDSASCSQESGQSQESSDIEKVGETGQTDPLKMLRIWHYLQACSYGDLLVINTA
ncbi:MAG: hypothetical protein Q7T07_10945 [Burkholderiaceae bacterium]|nr:hypothetical protein [Burkholderiaceae bacterium]